jgi:transposase InsO family protein
MFSSAQRSPHDHLSSARPTPAANFRDSINAPMESFFHTLKTELVHHRDYQTRDEARHDIFEFVEVFYNRQRSHSTLGYLSPVQFEVTALAA